MTLPVTSNPGTGLATTHDFAEACYPPMSIVSESPIAGQRKNGSRSQPLPERGPIDDKPAHLRGVLQHARETSHLPPDDRPHPSDQ